MVSDTFLHFLKIYKPLPEWRGRVCQVDRVCGHGRRAGTAAAAAAALQAALTSVLKIKVENVF